MCLFLPPDKDSLVFREIASRENYDEGYWDEGTQLIAHLTNLTSGIKYYQEFSLWAKGGGKQSDKPEAPEPIRPPGWRPEPVVMSTPEQLVRAFGGATYAE